MPYAPKWEQQEKKSEREREREKEKEIRDNGFSSAINEYYNY
jgi:hypothetical protein